jgi:hypothetical protein
MVENSTKWVGTWHRLSPKNSSMSGTWLSWPPQRRGWQVSTIAQSRAPRHHSLETLHAAQPAHTSPQEDAYMRCTLQQQDPQPWWRAPHHGSRHPPHWKAPTTAPGGLADARIECRIVGDLEGIVGRITVVVVCVIGGIAGEEGLAAARLLLVGEGVVSLDDADDGNEGVGRTQGNGRLSGGGVGGSSSWLRGEGRGLERHRKVSAALQDAVRGRMLAYAGPGRHYTWSQPIMVPLGFASTTASAWSQPFGQPNMPQEDDRVFF